MFGDSSIFVPIEDLVEPSFCENFGVLLNRWREMSRRDVKQRFEVQHRRIDLFDQCLPLTSNLSSHFICEDQIVENIFKFSLLSHHEQRKAPLAYICCMRLWLSSQSVESVQVESRYLRWTKWRPIVRFSIARETRRCPEIEIEAMEVVSAEIETTRRRTAELPTTKVRKWCVIFYRRWSFHPSFVFSSSSTTLYECPNWDKSHRTFWSLPF